MLINNLELIVPLVSSYNSELFYHMQIVCRAKDYKDEKVREGAIKTYFIRDDKHLRKIMPEVILLCEHYGARAYINVVGKDFKSLQTLMLLKLANDIHQGVVRNPRKCLNSAAGELKSRIPKWIVDIDDISLKDSIKDRLFELYAQAYSSKGTNISVETIKAVSHLNIFAEIPTKNGLHLIVRPFNTKAFNEFFPNVDIHKNSMGTLLYCPASLDK